MKSDPKKAATILIVDDSPDNILLDVMMPGMDGYPRGLAGNAIPLPGRLMAIPDVYDALINKRCYKEAFKHEEAVDIISAGAGKQFDPDIAAAFSDISSRFKEIAATFRDSEEKLS